MSLHRRAARRDTSEPELFRAAEYLGWKVCKVSVANGPDAFLARGGVTVAVECKTGNKPLRPGQKEWFERWPGDKAVLRTLDDVVRLLGDL